MLEKDIKKVLFSQEDIVAKTKELGQQLTEDYAGKNPLLVCVLKGAVPFMAELIKHIDTHIEMDFMVVSSYGGGTVSSGEVKILKDVDTNVEGRDIIFIEDIIDTGRTLLYLRDMFKYRKRLTKYLAAHQVNIRNIHVPKTIDNDLPLPEGIPTFGFTSAKEMGVTIGKVIKAEASTTQNWYLLMSMGREAGHLAFEIGKGIHASMIIIPEMFNKTQITIDKIVRLIISSMIKRRIVGQKFGVVVVGEGIFHFLQDEDIASSGITFDYDAHGHPELSEVSKAHVISKILKNRLKELNLDIICRPVEVGYSLRCVDPSAFDLTYCTTLGIGVKKLYDEGHSGCMVAVNLEEEVIPVYLKDVEDEHGKIRTRLVNIDKEVVRQTLAENIYYLTAQDRSLARKWLADPEPFEYERILG